MAVTSPKKATEFFEALLEFTTGPVELNRRIKEQDDVVIIDVRHRQDYKIARIPTSHSLPRELWSTFEGLSKDRVNVIYSYSEVCHLAAAAAKYFSKHDYPVMELQGGFEQWQKHKLPLEI